MYMVKLASEIISLKTCLGQDEIDKIKFHINCSRQKYYLAASVLEDAYDTCHLGEIVRTKLPK